jgi:hypothetical protein
MYVCFFFGNFFSKSLKNFSIDNFSSSQKILATGFLFLSYLAVNVLAPNLPLRLRISSLASVCKLLVTITLFFLQ